METREERHTRIRRKRRLFQWLILAGSVLLAALLAVLLLPHLSDGTDDTPDGTVTFSDKTGEAVLSADGDAESVFALQDEFCRLREKGKLPDTVRWEVTRDGTVTTCGTVKNANTPLPVTRLETLSAELTGVKLTYELRQSGVEAAVTAQSGENGKILGVTVDLPDNGTEDGLTLSEAAMPFADALKSVNEEGGGIGRCDVRFRQNGSVIAAVSFDLKYGITLRSGTPDGTE